MTAPFARAISRRAALKWIALAAGAAWLRPALGSASSPAGQGYGLDANLMEPRAAAQLWPRTFTPAQARVAAALCDVIIPSDGEAPAASAVGVPDFIDEWISAPYRGQQADRAVILPGLAWLDAEASRRFGADFAVLASAQHAAICDDICDPETAKAEFREPARFFRLFRTLTAGGYYTTPAGMADIGYTGNAPQAEFAGPSPEILARLGLA